MKKNLTKRGFIQIPILIGIIFATILTTSAVSYFGVKYFQPSSQQEVEKSEESISQKETENVQKQSINTTSQVSSKVETSNQVQDTELKIEQCRAIKENAYNDAVLKINQAINDRLQETFNNIESRRKQEINSIYSQSSYTGQDNFLTASDRLKLLKSDSTDKAYLADLTNQNYQSLWYNQKTQIENSKQKAIDQINLLLSEEYTKCLSK